MSWNDVVRRLAAVFAALPASLQGVLRKLWETICGTCRIYGEIDGEQRAASFAYYVLFSLFPLVVLMITVGSVFLTAQSVTDSIMSMLPLSDEHQKFIWEAVHRLEETRGKVGLISLAILLWSSLRFFLGLVRAVNRAWHTLEIPWWQLPLKNLLMVGILTSALFAGLLAPALLQGVRDALFATEQFMMVHFPRFDLHLAATLLDLGRYAIGGVVLFYSFSLLYMLAPRRRVHFRQVWIAALIVTLSLQICQVAFVSYLPRFVDYGIYGAVGGLMLLLLWVYMSGIIIIFGGCLCPAMDKVWGKHPQTDENSTPPAAA